MSLTELILLLMATGLYGVREAVARAQEIQRGKRT